MSGNHPIAFAHTSVKIPEFVHKLNHRQSVLTVGSCFSDEIGSWLLQRGYKVAVNPFGAIYYPPAITRLLRWAIEGYFPETGTIFSHELYKNLFLHSKHNNPQAQDYQKNIESLLISVRQYLKTSEWLFLSFGTSIYYHHRSTGIDVANCHKLPSIEFEKRTATVDELISATRGDLLQVQKANPHLKIILTVSPVRHMKEGLVENARSKAQLLLLCDGLIPTLANTGYFPAYEIMMDELRDYRFYKDDLLHPNKQAVDWIGYQFSKFLFDKDSFQLSEQYFKVFQALQHRPAWTHTEEYYKLKDHIHRSIQELESKADVNALWKLLDTQYNTIENISHGKSKK